jgi:hypothetical protein
MPKKRMKITPPCNCGERRVKTVSVKSLKVFGIMFRKPEKLQRCLACRRIRHREVIV